MAFKLNQVLILTGCLIAVCLADFAAQDLRRYARAKQLLRQAKQQNPRTLRPLKKAIKDLLKPSESKRFTDFDSYGQSQRDGAEYDQYGNRKKEQYGLGIARPRGYDRSDQYEEYESEPRPVYNYQKPSRTVDNNLKAVIDEVDPALYEIEQETQPASQRLDYIQAAPRSDYVPEYAPAPINDYAPAIKKPSGYRPASGPAFSSPHFATARQDLGPGVLEASVAAGANSYGAAVSPDGVYQNEDRLFFQIHGQEGPESYRYGYDTGNGYNRQFRYEERTAEGYVKGRYGFFDKYGKLHVVNYSADPIHGFHAEGAGVPEYPH